ncbi:hypothetical protein [uncultured Mucilaginibacter sp.]|uniref:hypothetical protein n=1 Tax=uncultured Mucilaginibacter sp. TaxID=797541 RepID=UPI0025D6CBEC|nr:hypothetical protein [uncultured Mucilaginibacter sp.]
MDHELSRQIVRKAWEGYDASKIIKSIDDISANVSTNLVFRIRFEDDDIVIAKLSSFGKYDYFKEDHRIIHSLSNNLLYPYENFLAKSLLKNNRVYIYRHRGSGEEAWVVFYNPTRIMERLPRRLEDNNIRKFAQQTAKFHKACARVSKVLPKSSKTMRTDINSLLDQIAEDESRFGTRSQVDQLRYHCDKYLKGRAKYAANTFQTIPVFIDWNIGNFSVTHKQELYSRWDYDWFRMTNRVMDFYFFSRVVSDVGDRTVFSYYITTLTEKRFIQFLEEYHKHNPLTVNEVYFMKEAYRFFILNYVIKDGKHFFHEQYANKLQQEAYDIYLPSVERDFDAEVILKALKLK